MNRVPKSSSLVSSLIYVNFAPYENAGRILDFLRSHSRLLVVFSFNFHQLNKTARSNYLLIYQDGILVQEKKLFRLPTPEALLFITLPLIAGLIALQTIFHLFWLKNKYGQFEQYLTVNAFTAWLGNLLRNWGVVKRTVFWVWDYYPPGYPDWRIQLARWAYWRVDRWSTLSSSRVIFLNKRLAELREQINVLSPEKTRIIVPIGTNPKIDKERLETLMNSKALALKPNSSQPNSSQSSLIIGHLGVLKRSQGLDLLFDHLTELQRQVPQLKVEIIGSGPDEAHFRSRASRFKRVKFYGFIRDENQVDALIKKWQIGLATYVPDISNAAYWTDPSKIKAYLSQGVPVITTAITPFSTEVKAARAGKVVDYFDGPQFCQAVLGILAQPQSYRRRALKLAQKYYYQDVYGELLS